MLSILNQRSNTHNSCEDSVYVHESESFIDGIVSDGCSTGIKSHFASQAICYAFKKAGVISRYTDEDVINQVRKNLLVLCGALDIDVENLLATCMLFHYNKGDKTLYVRVLGDGYYYVNNDTYEVDQNNEPDYLAYHIYDGPRDWHKYIDKHPEHTYENVTKFMICSDGIKRIERTVLQDEAKVDPEHLLFVEPKSSNYLTRMWNLIKRDGFTLSDDLSIVSYAENS